MLQVLLCALSFGFVSGRRVLHGRSAIAANCNGTSTHGDSVETWLAWLNDPPCEATAEAEALAARADTLAAALAREDLESLGDVDLVVAGSSYLDRYFVGFNMVMSRLEGRLVSVKRISGASSGADAPFDMLLMGETDALRKFLTFGLLGEKFSYVYYAGVSDQTYYFKAANWMISKYAERLTSLNDKMYVWMNCKGHCTSWFGVGCSNTSVEVHRFDDKDMAEKAYIATGTVHPPVDVDATHSQCTDGGVGKVFKDHLHAQITISPTKALNILSAATGYTMSEYADGIKKGQDAAIELLRTRKVSGSYWTGLPVILCPRGSQCKDPEMR